MNVEEMYNAINKGIPNMIKLELPTEELIKYCSENDGELLTSMRNIRDRYENVIVSLSGFNKSKHEFFSNLRLITNYKNSNTQIYVSPNQFIKRLKTILGVTSESLDLNDEELMKELDSRLATLISINDIDDLKEQFPIIFDDYKYSLYLSDEIRDIERNDLVSADYRRANFQKYGLDTRFKVFLSNQKEMYHHLIRSAKDIEEYANNNPIDLENFKGLDKDKFELYVANKYLEYAKEADEDKHKQAAIYYLTTYLNESCGHIVSMNYKGKELTNLSLLKDFRRFLRTNRELKPINEPRNVFDSYHIKHVKNHINKYFNGLDNWYVLKITPGEIIRNQSAHINRINDYNSKHPEIEDRDIKHLKAEKYMVMLMRKLNFYENSNYVLRLFGSGPFESHVAYFYSNGLVIVDKLYNEALNIYPTYNEAIYIMDTDTFLSMISMDKPELRDNDNVRRIIHSGDWEERLQKEIDKPTISLSEEDTLELTKKFFNK